MSRSIRKVVGSVIAAAPLGMALAAGGAAQDLQSFAIVAGESLTNTGSSTIAGNIAVSPGTSYTGSGTVTQTGETYLADAVAARMQNEVTTLYTVLAARPTSTGGDLTGQDLAGMTLAPGVYNFDSSANLAANGVLTLDAGGDPNAIFIINVGSTLTAGSGSSVVLIGQAQGGNVFYRVGSSATLDTSADLEGQIVAMASITMNTSAAISCGSAYARTGSVTLQANTIQICTLASTGLDEVILDPLLAENQQSVARALSDYVAAGGALPISFAILAATQTPEELAVSLAQLSGEVATGVAPMGMQSMDAFLDVLMGGGQLPRVRPTAPRDPGVAPGMVTDKINAPYIGKYGSEELEVSAQPLTYGAMQSDQPSSWDVWASAYGSNTVTEGDSGMGSQERTSGNRGLAVGVDFAPTASTDFGIALSWNAADFDLDNGFGSGSSDTVFAAVRGRTSTERAYVEGALAYGHSDITTERTVTIAGLDRLVGETGADNVAGHVEAGYRMGFFTPFAGLRGQSFTTEAYSETAEAGTSSYALRHEEHTTNSLRSELGVDMHWPRKDAGGAPKFGLRAAWAHEFATNDEASRSFPALPDATFTASGATRDRDSLILAASVGLSASNGIFVDGGINGQFSENARDVGGSVTVGYRW